METQPETLLGKRILLVEDERSLRETLGHLLRMDDHTVTEANNGAEALGMYTPNRFDVVLTDFQLPFLKGTELSTRIKCMAPDQPILMITSYGMRPGPHTCVDGVLRKPFDLDGLRSALAKVMNSKSSSQTDFTAFGTRIYRRIPMAMERESHLAQSYDLR